MTFCQTRKKNYALTKWRNFAQPSSKPCSHQRLQIRKEMCFVFNRQWHIASPKTTKFRSSWGYTWVTAFNEDNVPASVAFVPVSSAIAPASAAIKLFKNYSCPPRSAARIGKRDDAKQSANMKLAAARFICANKYSEMLFFVFFKMLHWCVRFDLHNKRIRKR